jgi:hypothetical protein
LRRAIPALDHMIGSDEAVDWKGFVGGNLGTPNFKDDAENRLFRNNAEASRVYQTISRLAKTKPDQAREMLKDPDNAAFALFHGDLQRITKGLRKIDEVRDAVEASNASDAEKKQRVQALEKFRTALLGHADALNNLLFKRRMAGRPKSKSQAPPLVGLPMKPPESAHP